MVAVTSLMKRVSERIVNYVRDWISGTTRKAEVSEELAHVVGTSAGQSSALTTSANGLVGSAAGWNKIGKEEMDNE